MSNTIPSNMEENEIKLRYDSTVIAEESIHTKEEVLEEVKVETNGQYPWLKGVIRVYQNNIPWQNRNNATILSLGKILGTDYFIQPIEDLIEGVPQDTRVILISSNSQGDKVSAFEETLPIVQENLSKFVESGGVLIVDMADNLKYGGYYVLGACGTPKLIFPDDDEGYKLYLTPNSYCSAFVNGPTIKLTNENISMESDIRWCAHGNLADGICIPERARILVTAIFNGVHKPVLASYCLGKGYVIVDTITKEFFGQNPQGAGPSNIITNLIHYAYYLRNKK